MTDEIAVSLSTLERSVLRNGMTQWLGPARCSDPVAAVIGFDDTSDLHRNIRRLIDLLDSGAAMSGGDWRRLLVSAEIMFGSDVLGCGVEWRTVTGHSDVETIEALRGLQRMLASIVRGRGRPDEQ